MCCTYTYTLVHTPEAKRAVGLSFQPSPPVSPDTYAISSPLSVPFSHLFLPRYICPSSFDSRAPPVHVHAGTHARFNPLCDDERTPLESFDIGDVGKYIRRTDLSDILPPFSTRGGGQTKNFNRDSRERERGVIIASKRIFATISRFQDCVVKIVPRRVLTEANFASKGGCLLNA